MYVSVIFFLETGKCLTNNRSKGIQRQKTFCVSYAT